MQSSTAQHDTTARGNVLLVEDDLELRCPVAGYLRHAGYQVTESASVDEAVAVLRSDAPIDAVFSDIHLSGKLTGNTLARWVAHNRPQMPVLLTSGDPRAQASTSACAAHAFIGKPYDLDALDHRLQAMIDEFRHPAASESRPT